MALFFFSPPPHPPTPTLHTAATVYQNKCLGESRPQRAACLPAAGEASREKRLSARAHTHTRTHTHTHKTHKRPPPLLLPLNAVTGESVRLGSRPEYLQRGRAATRRSCEAETSGHSMNRNIEQTTKTKKLKLEKCRLGKICAAVSSAFCIFFVFSFHPEQGDTVGMKVCEVKEQTGK